MLAINISEMEQTNLDLKIRIAEVQETDHQQEFEALKEELMLKFRPKTPPLKADGAC